MPLNLLNFNQLLHEPNNTGLSNLFRNYYEGMEMSQAPQKMAQERLQGELQNKILGSQAEFAQPMAQANLQKQQQENEFYGRSKEADIAKVLAEAQRAGMGGDFTGTAGNLARLNMLKKKPNADQDLIAALTSQMDLERKREEGIYEHQKKMTDTVYYRSAPTSQKLLMNVDALGQNKTYDMEGNKIDLTPAQAKQRQNVIGKEVLKNTTDPALRQRLEFAQNFATTVKNIDPESAFSGSGGLGKMSTAWNKTKGSLGGKESEEYKKFEQNLTRLKVGSHQISKFFALSSAEKIQSDVDYLVNPSNWMRSPAVAASKYKALVDIFDQEHQNMLKMATSSQGYGLDLLPAGEEAQTPEQVLSSQLQDGIGMNAGDMITIKNPKTGETKQVSRSAYEKSRKNK